jgi:cytosine/adenosine deaminase-related metal-dependent hydrolase
MPHFLRARVLFPVDRPAIEHGIVTIDGPRIVAVAAKADDDVSVRNLGNVALFPGFVNAHTHLEFSDLQQPLGERGIPLPDWIAHVLAQRRSGSRDPAAAIAAGCRESLSAGVTTIGEIATAEANDYSGALPIDLTTFVECIGFSRARAESAFEATAERLRTFDRESGTQLGLSPHAPYTVSPGLVRRLVELARARRLPMAMHIAESADELELLDRGTGRFQRLLEERSMWDDAVIPRGSAPFDYLQLLASAPRALVVHGNYLDREERDFLATHADRMSLVYCPRTHAYFEHPPYPLAESLAAGVRVALGTDSRASNPDLSLIAEMRFAATSHPDVPPETVLRMGTLSGAEALGRDVECGSITPGKLANLVAIPFAPGSGATPDDILAGILATEAEPVAAWYRGQELASAASRH